MNNKLKQAVPFLFIAQLLTLHTNAQKPVLQPGTKTPYQAPGQRCTPPPDGYLPVFINHAGRHGARFLTKAGSDTEVGEVLSFAAQKHGLTATGVQLEQMTRRFLSIEAGNYENITGLGRNEQAGIAARMLHNYKKAFRGNGLEVIMTHKVRTQQSADAFLAAFGGYTGKKNYCVVPDSLDNTLRFYDLSPAYLAFKRSEAVRRPVDSLNKDARTKAAADAVCTRIFNPGFAPDAVSFVENLYDLYCVQLSIPVEMQQKGYNRDSIDFGIAFTPRDLEWLAFKNGAEDFLEKGAGTDTLGIQVRVALPLLADFLSSTEAVIGNKAAPDARLRFTHAEAIAPFATLLGLPQASIPSSSIYQYYAHWKAESIAPLSANIQWILYSNGKDYLVKALLNENETALPLPTDTYPFYRWEAVKTYYLDKLRRLHASPQQDMQRYLRELQ